MNPHHFKVCHRQNLGLLDYDEARFERIFGIHYIKKMEFANEQVKELVLKRCQKLVSQNRIGVNAKWLGTLYEKFIASAFMPSICIKWIDEKIGYGVFAQEPIIPWQYIGEYAGTLRLRRLLFPDINDYCFMYPELGLFYKRLTIDGKDQGNFTRFINHSDTPNIESISVFCEGYYRIIFRSIKHIPIGTELTYDYGDVYWLNRRNKIEPINDEK